MIANPYLLCAESKRFKPDIRVVHVRDLNFVLRSEIFVHTDGQLRASHLILGVNPVYSTWQPFSQALLVDSPLISYIDVRHANFLPPRLTAGEARDHGPRYICSDERPPIRDESAERVSAERRRRAHEQIQQAPAQPERTVEPEAPAREGEGAAAETTDSSKTGSDQDVAMVARRQMTIDRFVPSARPIAQQQQTPARDASPPAAQPTRVRKRARTTDQTQTGSGNVPPRPPAGIVIREPVAQTEIDLASTSRAPAAWRPSLKLGGEPLPSTASARMWDKGHGGSVAQSLARGILLPEDLHVFTESTDESLGRRLQWHTIAVTVSLFSMTLGFPFDCVCSFHFTSQSGYCVVRLRKCRTWWTGG